MKKNHWFKSSIVFGLAIMASTTMARPLAESDRALRDRVDFGPILRKQVQTFFSYDSAKFFASKGKNQITLKAKPKGIPIVGETDGLLLVDETGLADSCRTEQEIILGKDAHQTYTDLTYGLGAVEEFCNEDGTDCTIQNDDKGIFCRKKTLAHIMPTPIFACGQQYYCDGDEQKVIRLELIIEGFQMEDHGVPMFRPLNGEPSHSQKGLIIVSTGSKQNAE
ncbi:MAG: hypothetical protein HRU19_15700 [Pseudobacteriovorax sp.]|nr:hypothetical protein [Pseudobacteriovorax sp.]